VGWTTDRVHVDAVREGARVLVGLYQSVGERLRYEVELDEFPDAGEFLVVLLGAAVQTQHDRRHVAEDRRTHQRCSNTPSTITPLTPRHATLITPIDGMDFYDNNQI